MFDIIPMGEIPVLTPEDILLILLFLVSHATLIHCIIAVLEALGHAMLTASFVFNHEKAVWAYLGITLAQALAVLLQVCLLALGQGGGHGLP